MSSPGEHRPDDGGYRGAPGPGPGPADLPHVYNPYSGVSYPSSYPVPPAGLGPGGPVAPVRRPRVVHLGLLLLLVSTLPYLLSGLLMALGADQITSVVPPEQLEPLRAAGVDPTQVVRTGGIVVLVIAAVFALFALLAWAGRRWARALVAAMTVGFALMALVALVGGGAQAAGAAGLLVVLGPAVLAAVGVALLFRPAARAWYGRARP